MPVLQGLEADFVLRQQGLVFVVEAPAVGLRVVKLYGVSTARVGFGQQQYGRGHAGVGLKHARGQGWAWWSRRCRRKAFEA